MPVKGGHCWDVAGGPLADAAGLAAFNEAMRDHCPANVRLLELDAHINDAIFAATALQVFDGWIADGLVRA